MDFQKVRQIKRKGAIIVKKEFLTSNAKFVYSKNELGYQEVLDRFKDAKQITIITFNISEKQNTLVNALKKQEIAVSSMLLRTYQIDGKPITVTLFVIKHEKNKSIHDKINA